MSQNPNALNRIKTREEVLSGLSGIEVDPVQQAILDVLLEIREGIDSMPGNRRRMMRDRGVRPDISIN